MKRIYVLLTILLLFAGLVFPFAWFFAIITAFLAIIGNSPPAKQSVVNKAVSSFQDAINTKVCKTCRSTVDINAKKCPHCQEWIDDTLIEENTGYKIGVFEIVVIALVLLIVVSIVAGK